MVQLTTTCPLKSFVGSVYSYRCFISNFSVIAPFNKITKRARSLSEWDDHCTESFKHLKKAWCSKSVLIYPKLCLPYYLCTESNEDFLVTCLLNHICLRVPSPTHAILFAKNMMPINVHGVLLPQRLNAFLVGRPCKSLLNGWSLEVMDYKIKMTWITQYHICFFVKITQME